MTKTYKEILLYEIEANSHSYTLNSIVTKKGNKRYSVGITLTITALIFSIVLIVANKFIKVEKVPTKVQVAQNYEIISLPNIQHYRCNGLTD